jgi:hypothetical protein
MIGMALSRRRIVGNRSQLSLHDWRKGWVQHVEFYGFWEKIGWEKKFGPFSDVGDIMGARLGCRMLVHRISASAAKRVKASDTQSLEDVTKFPPFGPRSKGVKHV